MAYYPLSLIKRLVHALLRTFNAQKTIILSGSVHRGNELVVKSGDTLRGHVTIKDPVSVSGKLAPGLEGAFGSITVKENLSFSDASTLEIALENTQDPGIGYSFVRVEGVVELPKSGTITLTLKGIESHNIEGGDTLRILFGKVENFAPQRIRIDNQTSWTGNWVIASNGDGILVTATEIPLNHPATSVDTAKNSEGLSVIFLGDSITGSGIDSFIGYARIIRTSRPDWEVDIVSVTTAENLVARLQQESDLLEKYDVIYVNIGLHSIRQDRFEDLATFETNLSQAAQLLKALEGPMVIWRTTTPIAEGASGERDYKQVPIYNDVAKRIMQRAGIPIHDLYEYLMAYYNEDSSRGGKYILEDGTHWSTQSQNNIIAPEVARAISDISNRATSIRLP